MKYLFRIRAPKPRRGITVISLLDTEKEIKSEDLQYVHKVSAGRDGYLGRVAEELNFDTSLDKSTHSNHPDSWKGAWSVATILTGTSGCRFQIRDVCTEIN